MADYHFFTDYDLMLSQTASMAYGSIGSDNSASSFRVASIHSSSTDSNAYSICDGILCIQQSEDTELVNLILKPNKQPKVNLPFIKYYIYRGILKSSLLGGNGDILNDGNNELLLSVKNSWEAYLTSKNLPLVPASGNALGIHLNSGTGFMNADPIDNLFYNNTSSYQLPTVEGGWMIGKFNSTAYGLEIITENIGYMPKLELTRKADHIIEVEDAGQTATHAEIFKHWHDKEEILNYMDPCAFYGSLYMTTIKAKASTGEFESRRKNEIFDDILKGAHHVNVGDGNFHNRSVTCFDIRNHHNQSFNYYKNYGVDVKLGFDENTPLSNSNYYDSGWPLLLIDQSLFPTQNSSEFHFLRLSLPLSNNANPVVYIGSGYRYFKLNPFRKLKNKKQFVSLNYVDSEEFTNEVKLIIPNNNGIPVSSWVSIQYISMLNPEQPLFRNNSFYDFKRLNTLDNLFVPFQMNVPFPDNGVSYKTYQDETFIEKSNGQTQFMANIGIAMDEFNVTLYAVAKSFYKRKNIRTGKPLILGTSQHLDYDNFLDFLNQRVLKNQLSSDEIKLSNGDIEVLSFSPESMLKLDSLSISETNADDILLLVFDKETFQNTLPGLINSSSLNSTYKIFFGAKAIQTFFDDNGAKYTAFNLLLRGYTEVNNNLEILEIPTEIILYSHDII